MPWQRNTRSYALWIGLGFALVVAAVYVTVYFTLGHNSTNRSAEIDPGLLTTPTPGLALSPSPQSSAVAGEQPPAAVLRVENGSFSPSNATVKQGDKVTIQVVDVAGCEVTIDGRSINQVIIKGTSYTWTADGKGDHQVNCEGRDNSGAMVTVQ